MSKMRLPALPQTVANVFPHTLVYGVMGAVFFLAIVYLASTLVLG
jgi:hypothetical protein